MPARYLAVGRAAGDWSPIRVDFGITGILAMLDSTGLSRAIPSKLFALREDDYATALGADGRAPSRIIGRHLLPGFMSHLIATTECGSDAARRRFLAASTAVAAGMLVRHVRAAATIPTVGFLNSATPELYEFNVAAFRQGLQGAGFVEGRNVSIEYRWARGDYDRLPVLASELVRAGVSAIAATGDVQSARAAQAATKTIPIVFTIGGDPVRFGLVASYNQPGGNTTGISLITSAMGGKRIELLHELAPRSLIALFMNPDNPNAPAELEDAQLAARKLGHRTVVLNARNAGDFDAAFAAFTQQGANALFVGTDPMILSQRERLVVFAARQRVPAIYWVREFADLGGLLSYGASIRFMYHEAGVYIGRILKGAHPSTIPVLQPTKVEMVINRRTARSLGLELPNAFVLRADEVLD